jgi:transcription initiation factor TFIIIB Brf1 subunit/transcription initiation factor TFIIB
VSDADEIVRRLNLIEATLRVAFEPQITALSGRLRADDVAAAILDRTAEWVGSGGLQKAVAKATGKTTRTVQNRLPELVAHGAIETRGPEARPEYRRTGLV